jgi:hypothetical protein
MTKQDQSISYKELYELIDNRFNKFEDKLDDRIGQLHDRIDNVHIRITDHIKESELRFKPLETRVQKLWIYLTFGVAILAIVIELGIAWLRKVFHI